MTNYKSNSCSSREPRSDRHRSRSREARKERVLHTRVSEQLSEDIRKFAEELRVPASNLVRNVLEEVFTVVDGMSDDVGDLFDDLIEEAEGVRERVRNQSESRSRHTRHRRSPWRRRSRHSRDNEDVEAEFRTDEAKEAGGSKTRNETKRGSGAVREASEESADANQEKPRAAEIFPDILGWQPLVLNRDFACGRCGRSLAAGDHAFLGLGESGLTQTALCGRCAGQR